MCYYFSSPKFMINLIEWFYKRKSLIWVTFWDIYFIQIIISKLHLVYRASKKKLSKNTKMKTLYQWRAIQSSYLSKAEDLVFWAQICPRSTCANSVLMHLIYKVDKLYKVGIGHRVRNLKKKKKHMSRR